MNHSFARKYVTGLIPFVVKDGALRISQDSCESEGGKGRALCTLLA
jgi:hypothetical protein